jgi:hypothetical protein
MGNVEIEANLWQCAKDVTAKKKWLDVGKNSMNLAFSSKLKLAMRAKLWRLPPVGFANDIETGDFEVDETVMGATDRLFER